MIHTLEMWDTMKINDSNNNNNKTFLVKLFIEGTDFSDKLFLRKYVILPCF